VGALSLASASRRGELPPGSNRIPYEICRLDIVKARAHSRLVLLYRYDSIKKHALQDLTGAEKRY